MTERNSESVTPAEMQEILEVKPLCPHCGRALPGMNILSMELQTPQGGMQWLLPSCPFVAGKEGKAVDGGDPCGKVIGTQFVGYKAPTIAKPSPWLG